MASDKVYDSKIAATARYWSEAEPWSDERGMVWTELPRVRARLERKVSGSEESWLNYTIRRHLQAKMPLADAFILCCGNGALERALVKKGVFEHCDAIDISPARIAEAARRASEEGLQQISYAAADANRLDLPPASYDVVWSVAAAHHVERLERLFEQVHQALRPDGLFILHEYTGPSRFQFDASQREVIQACYRLLPEHYRRPVKRALAAEVARNPFRQGLPWMARRVWDKAREGDLLAAIQRRIMTWRLLRGHKAPLAEKALPTRSSVVATDPSEAVRSAEIIPLLRSYFEIIEIKPLGGSLLHFLLDGIAGNFRDGEAGDQWLDFLFAVEDGLMELGRLQSDFHYIVARVTAQN